MENSKSLKDKLILLIKKSFILMKNLKKDFIQKT